MDKLREEENFKIPETSDIFDDVIFTELQRDEAEKLVKLYNEEGRAASEPPKKVFKPNDDDGSNRRFDGDGNTSVSQGGFSSSKFDSHDRRNFDNQGFNMNQCRYGRRGSLNHKRGEFNGGRGRFPLTQGSYNNGKSWYNPGRNSYDGRGGSFSNGRNDYFNRRGMYNTSVGSFGNGRGGYDGVRNGYNGGRGGQGDRGRFNSRRGNFQEGRGFFNGNNARSGRFNSGRGGFERGRGNSGHSGFDNKRGFKEEMGLSGFYENENFPQNFCFDSQSNFSRGGSRGRVSNLQNYSNRDYTSENIQHKHFSSNGKDSVRSSFSDSINSQKNFSNRDEYKNGSNLNQQNAHSDSDYGRYPFPQKESSPAGNGLEINKTTDVRPSGRKGTRWSAETTHATYPSTTTASSNLNHVAPGSTESVVSTVVSQYPTNSNLTQSNPPLQASASYVYPSLALTAGVPTQQWPITQFNPASLPMNPTVQATNQSQWAQYYQQVQAHQYFSQYYTQPVSGTFTYPPACVTYTYMEQNNPS